MGLPRAPSRIQYFPVTSNDPGQALPATPVPGGGASTGRTLAPGTASPGGTAPPGRRRAHLLAGLVGAGLPPALLCLTGLALAGQTGPGPSWRWLLLVVVLVVSVLAQSCFAYCSSLGNLVAGLVALVAQVLVLVAPDGVGSVPCGWARQVLPSGALLVLAAWFLGGSWAMRQARRAGRAEARAQAALAQADEDPHSVPAPSPSRRGAHLLTLLMMLLVTWGGLRVLPGQYRLLVEPHAPGAANAVLVVSCFALLLVAAAASAWSSLGARATALTLGAVALPALVGDGLPGHRLLSAALPDLSPAVALALACVLSALGWGLHLARKQGREHVGADPDATWS